MTDNRMVWAGGEHAFALDIGALRALQAACDAGPEQILRRLIAGLWRVDDLVETIRLGLIGGGEVAAKDAGALVTRMFSQHPVLTFRPLATAILAAALTGPADDPVGEPTGVELPPESSSSAGSMATAP